MNLLNNNRRKKPIRLIILGSTGSIGVQAVEIALKYQEKYQVVAISTNSNASLAIQQAKKLNCKTILVANKKKADLIQKNIPSDITLYKGMENIKEILEINSDVVVNALVGSVGLEATILALEKNVRLALANKESLVVGGDLINSKFKEKKKDIIPVDSEHSAIYQLLSGEDIKEVKNIIITASGGPFRKLSFDEMKKVTVKEALAHPKWNMGAKISIDSATLANKGLEVMEAHYLFNMPYEKIKVVIHPQSIIHSMVEFIDGSVKAHLGPTDMRIPIQYALSYPKKFISPVGFLDFIQLKELTFEPIDLGKFKALKLAYEAGKKACGYPVVFNAANEIAVEAFLTKRISFTMIAEVIEKMMDEHTARNSCELEIIKELDKKVREKALKVCKMLKVL